MVGSAHPTLILSLIHSVIDDIKKMQPIDSSRIYATGISNGGFMTQRLVCELSDRIAAFASVGTFFNVLTNNRDRMTS
jgi:poly(3-hydroxybutyrate) depolymerase